MGHLHNNRITYIKHFKRSIKFSVKSLYASLCFLIHAFIPDVLENKGSSIIKEMNNHF